MGQSYRNMAGEFVAEHARYIGHQSPRYAYHVRFEGKSYFSNDTDELADQIASAMRSNAAKLRTQK